ncbi:hypothetical protein I5907_12430 [Panacibacter sp. DH6]|uniref:Outer membrane lipoprotein-sorting protein n=1 Tax=Panacibacter microcysteis TaxID=2793269 RepID=A0A931E4S1_9BACT|nr:hypothetical protein [Panacibacter microcysteis]MBG9377043.1 hypothetical protein [Panacibacter microcysteis]
MGKAIRFILVFTCFLQISVYAQDSVAAKTIMTFFNGVRNAYAHSGNIGFNVNYVYSDEKYPEKIIDTLSGTYKINGSKYWFSLAQTETMKNDSLVIMIFHEDKMMYVRKASTLPGFDPVEQMQAFLKKAKTVRAKLTKGKSVDQLSITFPEGLDYKSVNIKTDRVTGYLVESEYIIRTQLLTDQADDEADETKSGFSEYARVRVNYSAYHQDTDSSCFDESRFIIRRNNVISTEEKYKDFKIVIGSSNL